MLMINIKLILNLLLCFVLCGGVACIPFFFLHICLRVRTFKKDKLLDKKEGGTQNVAEDIAGAVDPDVLSKHSAIEEARGDDDKKDEVELQDK